jgi:hypothetical protein
MVDLLVALWDGKEGAFEKQTKGSGNDTVVNPWINIVACTTPAWIAGNFPEYMIGGGFTSRCLFVYADAKNKHIAYPAMHVPEGIRATEDALVADLEHIATKIAGNYVLTADAVRWGEQWYKLHYSERHMGLEDDRFGGYLARKQTHVHKLAMILAASEGDSLSIDESHLALADRMVTDLELDMPKVFSRIGVNPITVHTERLMQTLAASGGMPVMELRRALYSAIPSQRDYMDVLEGLVKAGMVGVEQVGGQLVAKALTAKAPPPSSA